MHVRLFFALSDHFLSGTADSEPEADDAVEDGGVNDDEAALRPEAKKKMDEIRKFIDRVLEKGTSLSYSPIVVLHSLPSIEYVLFLFKRR